MLRRVEDRSATGRSSAGGRHQRHPAPSSWPAGAAREGAASHGLLVRHAVLQQPPPQAGWSPLQPAGADATSCWRCCTTSRPLSTAPAPGRDAAPPGRGRARREVGRAGSPRASPGSCCCTRPAATSASYYSGDDAATLPLLAIGAVGVVGTLDPHQRRGHQADDRGVRARDVDRAARRPHQADCCSLTGFFRTQGTILVKARADAVGRPPARCRRRWWPRPQRTRARRRSDATTARAACRQLPTSTAAHPGRRGRHRRRRPRAALRVIAARRPRGAIGRNMTVFEYGGKAAHRRLRGALPDGGASPAST